MSKEDDYQVGYKKPPKHSRFKKGQSGNPKGRPRKKPEEVVAPGSANLRGTIFKVMTRETKVTEDGVTRKIPMIEAILLAQATKAVKGSPYAARQVMNLMIAAIAEQEEEQLRLMELLLAKEDALEEAYQNEQAGKGPD